MLNEDIYEKIFQNAKRVGEDFVDKDRFLRKLHRNGILKDDPRI